jgi:hypothetical protein
VASTSCNRSYPAMVPPAAIGLRIPLAAVRVDLQVGADGQLFCRRPDGSQVTVCTATEAHDFYQKFNIAAKEGVDDYTLVRMLFFRSQGHFLGSNKDYSVLPQSIPSEFRRIMYDCRNGGSTLVHNPHLSGKRIKYNPSAGQHGAIQEHVDRTN